MSVGPLRLPVALPNVTRSERDRVLAGVCSGVAERLGVDATLVRLTVALFAFASGAGIVAYLGAWALLPAPGAAAPSRRRRLTGAVLLVWAAILALLGVGLAGALVWPLALVAAGLVVAAGAGPLGLREGHARIGAAILIFAGVVVFLGENTRGTATTLLAPGAVAVALILVLGPWVFRLAHERDAERAARIRTEEREELATRVHDSVLQTLALIQREPNDARRVATLARRQERELRAWLYPEREPAAEGTLADAVNAAAAEMEELHGVRVEVVRTGDAPIDERTSALVLAAREAMANASRHSGAAEVSVFLDADAKRIALYVRDRGSGFDPDAVAADRRGVAESIRGRMERVGGIARIVSSPGEGTEVELELPEAGS
ncbi:MAG TPA: PspC domain-containing protein [Gaiellaceae bacterium]|nr:PspC domain-containing protein [Gaiellaceae bacterium]